MKKNIRIFVLATTLSVMFVCYTFADTINIPADYSTIQAGINASVYGDTVLVDTGRYVENINYNGKNIVLASLFLTTQDTSYISQTIIDGNQNESVVKFYSGEDSTAVLYGFTITNGNTYYGGGGIYCYDSSPSLENITITENSAGWDGGGIYCSNSSPSLVNVTITNNTASRYGGGIYCSNFSSPTLSNVTITRNLAGYQGGGINLFDDSNPIFDSENRCNIYLNTAYCTGNDLYCWNCPTIEVIVDTFTVMTPTDYYVSPLDGFTFDILKSVVEQFDYDLYVSPNGNNTNSGVSPSEPLGTINYAFSRILADSLNHHTIYLLDGIYSPSLNDEVFPIGMVSYVTLLGTSVSEVVLDAEENSSVMVFDVDKDIEVQNIFITGGSDNKGGGIFCSSSSPILKNIIITDNRASYGGGGIYCFDNSSPSLENVTITDNSASVYGGGIYCGGVYCDDNSSLSFSSENRCNIYSNTIESNKGYGIDIFSLYCDAIDVILDTFTVMTPTDYYASPIDSFTFDILHSIQDNLINSDVYVAVDGDNSNTGTSPDEPFRTIKYALSRIYSDSLNHNTIHLASGVYSASTNGETFPVVWNNYVSLCGSGENETILDANQASRVMKFRHITEALIQDIKLTNGSADFGGGIYCGTSSLNLENVTITDNSASAYGGGICCYSSSPSLQNVTITGNIAYCGGGIYCDDNSSPSLVNVTITDNSTDYGCGGGIYCYDNSSPSIVNSIVSDNSGNYGIYVDSGNPTITFSDFWNNENGNFYGVNDSIGLNITTNANGDSCDAYYNIQMNPLFVDPLNGDYHLSWANFPIQDSTMSPCIDAGDPNSPLDPDGTISDMGAFYFNQGVSTDEPVQPSEFNLTNYPNPINSNINNLTISFTIKTPGNVKIQLFNLKGQFVLTLINEEKNIGEYLISHPINELSSGIYFTRMSVDGVDKEIRKVVLLR